MRSKRGLCIVWLFTSACATTGEPSESTPERTTAAPDARPTDEPQPDPQPDPGTQAPNEPQGGPPAGELDPAVAELALQVVPKYREWGRVDDEFRWAPGLCRMPTPALARFSESDDEASHGDKIYTVYAMDPVAYGARPSAGGVAKLPGIEQVLVKEAFAPTTDPAAASADRLRPAERDGQRFHAGEPRGLYLLMKLAEREGTDEGWVYATVMPDNVTVTSAGLVQRCMGCHQRAPHERWFGLPQPERPRANDRGGL